MAPKQLPGDGLTQQLSPTGSRSYATRISNKSYRMKANFHDWDLSAWFSDCSANNDVNIIGNVWVDSCWSVVLVSGLQVNGQGQVSTT